MSARAGVQPVPADCPVVTLTPAEVLQAATAGAYRYVEALASGRRDQHGLGEDVSGLHLHIDGAAGEAAVAKWLGQWWGADCRTFKAPDLGGLQIRCRSRHDYDLIVRDADAADERFVLVTGVVPRFVLRGWVWGREARRDAWVRRHGGRPPAWFVPSGALRPMASLVERGVAGWPI